MSDSTTNQLPRGPLIILIVCWLLMWGSFLFPPIPLDGQIAEAAVYVANSGSLWGVPGIVVVLALLLVSRSGLNWTRRLMEIIVLLVFFAVVLKGGSWLNEELLKPLLGVHRPNAISMDDEHSLGMSLEAFYNMPVNAERSAYLKQILENKYFEGVKLSEPVRQHWIAEGGFSLPSGHTLGAFTVLTVALFSTWTLTSGWRFVLSCLLVPWAIAVSYSRILLLMHWPNDLIVSAMAGILLGTGLFVSLRSTLWKSTLPKDVLAEDEGLATSV